MPECRLTRDRFRYTASKFARLAVSEVLFWEKLGFNADQLEAVSVAGETDMLTPILDGSNECLAANTDAEAAFVFRNEAKFAYVPATDSDIVLECSHLLKEVEATPQAMELVFEEMLEKLNYDERFELLNRPSDQKLIYPKRSKRWKGRTITLPLNSFPLEASASFDGNNLELHINTKKGQGSILQIQFPPDNCFGLAERHIGYEKTTGKIKSVVVKNHVPLGARDHHAIVTSGDLHMSRTLVRPAFTNQCLVAVFPSEDENADQPYLPLNRLSSTTTYDRIQFRMFSAHRNENYVVTKECYSYLFVFEIRGYS
jgi:hypothetical protein